MMDVDISLEGNASDLVGTLVLTGGTGTTQW